MNPRITTDSSIECSSAEAVVRQITNEKMTDEQKVRACWRFMLDHFYHWWPAKEKDAGGDVRDFAKALNSYGFGPCFVNAPVLTALWEAAGYETRSYTVTGHSIPEVKYGGGWHMLDGDARAWHRGPDGEIASVADLARSVARDKTKDKTDNLFTKPKEKSVPYYPYGAPDKYVKPFPFWGPPSRMLDLYGSTRNNYRYNRRAVMGHPMYLTLRQGETLTLMRKNVGKFYNAGFPKEQVDAGGPRSKYTDVTYSSGRLVWKPDLGTIPADQLLWMGSKNVKLDRGRLIAEEPGQPAVAVFRVWCPWVMVESKATMVAFKEAMSASFAVSFDGGTAWSDLGGAPWIVEKSGIGQAKLDLTRYAAGRYEILLRATFQGGSIRLREFNTLFQVATLSLPKLKVGKNQVTISRGPDESVVQLVRSGAKPAKKRYIVESKGIKVPNYVQPTKYGQPAYVVYRLRAPNELTALSVGGALTMDASRRPQHITASYSLDGGKTWAEIWKLGGNRNRQNSLFEMDKRVSLDANGKKEVLIRFDMLRNSKYFGVNAIRLYAFYKNPQPEDAKLVVDFAWEENRGGKWVGKKTTMVVGTFPHTFDVECGGDAARLSSITMKPEE
ncbi:MAG: hypothetical protein R6V58_08100 [Planctomycetota bacterium]